MFTRPVLALILAAASAQTQQLKIKEDQGHISPVRAKITLRNDKTREVVVQGVGQPGGALSHVFVVRTEDGVSKRVLWIDAIASITDLDKIRRTQDEFRVKMKDGTAFTAMFVGATHFSYCQGGAPLENPKEACSTIHIGNGDDSTETLDMRDLKSIVFLPRPRKDKLANAMLDTWRYSPFTGERLPH